MAGEEKKPKPEKKPAKQKGEPKGERKAEKKGEKKAEKKGKAVVAKVPSRVKARYREQVVPELQQKLGYKSVMAVPKLEKITVSMGLRTGKDKDARARIEAAAADLTTITGQKPRQTVARRAVAGFGLREGLPVGLQVTLRGPRMYDFFDRLVSVAIPRVRDFQGLPRGAFDRAGNYSLGIREQTVFPEVDINKVTHTQGMNVTLTVRSRRPADAEALLEALGFPLVRG
jgi:large subunit ribosomal protein L5